MQDAESLFRAKIKPILSRDCPCILPKSDSAKYFCHIYTGPVQKNGYGTYTYRLGSILTTEMAHRYSYKLSKGIETLSSKITIDHICVYQICVRYSHLQSVSLQENIRLRDERSREVGL